MSLKSWWDYPAYNDPKYDTAPPPEKLETSRADQALDEDHLTTHDAVYGLGHYGLDRKEPVFKHRELCPGVLEQTRAFLANLDHRALDIRTDVLRQYEAVPIGRRASKLALVELIAVAVHAIAVHLFKQVDGGLHKDEKYPSDEHYKQYNIAAYWVEDQIFGGIVLFDQGESGTERNVVWFHSSRRGMTDHAYTLKDDQIASLHCFLESGPGEAASPFPILGDRSSIRKDWQISIPKYNIYRDRWERKIRFISYRWHNHYQSKCRAFDQDPVENPEWGHENEP